MAVAAAEVIADSRTATEILAAALVVTGKDGAQPIWAEGANKLLRALKGGIDMSYRHMAMVEISELM